MPVAAVLIARKRRWRVAWLVLAALLMLPTLLAWTWPVVGSLRGPSASTGTTVNGSLSGARAFTPFGRGHVTCGLIVSAAARQHAHSRVVDAVTEGLADASERTGRRYVLGESAWPGGGRFKPHRTHASGLSVDLFVPFETKEGLASTPAFTPWSWFGYRFELDEAGELGRHRLDWDDLTEALVSIASAAERQGLEIERIYLTPPYQKRLFADGRRGRLGALASRFNSRPSWWRHDEHVHIDFRLIASD